MGVSEGQRFAKVDTPLLDNPLCAQCGEPLRPRPVRVNGRVIWRRPPKYCSTRCRSAAAAAARPGVWEANRRAVADLAAECRRRHKTALEVIRGDAGRRQAFEQVASAIRTRAFHRELQRGR